MPAARKRSLTDRPRGAGPGSVRLLLVRHAIAQEKGSQWPRDGSRTLTPRGIEKARRAALGLKRLLPRPARLFASPLVRTAQTAAILHQHARWPLPQGCRLLAPGADPAELLAFLARSVHGQGRNPTLVLVGHEPDLGQLLAHCLAGTPAGTAFGLRKMGAALLHFPQRVKAGGAVLLWFATPKMLRALR